jgi:hypothetical protein
MNMPILRTLQLFALIISFTLFQSCKKDSNSTNTVKTSSLTGVTWTSTKIEYQQTDGSWKDEQTIVNPLDTHVYTFIFNTDNTFSVKSVNSFSNTTKTGTWHFINNNSQITLSGNIYADTYTVTQLTSSTLQWTVIPSAFFGKSGVRETFGH